MTLLRFEPAPFDRDGWDHLIEPFADLGLTQCWAYGEARAAAAGWSVERGVAEEAGRVVAAAQVMLRALPAVGGGLAWIGRGPLWRHVDAADDAGGLVEVLAALRRHYVDARGFYLRVAPPVRADSALCANAIAGAGFRATDSAGWASAVVDLTRDVAAIRARLDQKWRNSLNKAERLDAAVERADDDAAFRAFNNEYRRFLATRGFDTTVTPELLETLQRLLAPGRKLVAYRALHQGTPLGSALLTFHGRTVEYLAGTVLEAGRRFNVGQLLLWRAMCDSKHAGYTRFDVGGLDPQLTPMGIFAFKSGLGGTPYHYVNEIEADDGGVRARLVRWRVARARAALAAGAGA